MCGSTFAGRPPASSDAGVRERISRLAPRCDCHKLYPSDRCGTAGDTDDTDRIRNGRRPIRAGFVASLPRPGGNLTGFVNLEISTAGKWLELLTEISPSVKRVAVIFNPDTAPGGGTFFLPVVEAAARWLNVEPITAPVRSDAEIEMVITALGREPGGGILVLPDPFTGVHRAAIISQAIRNKVPAVAGLPQFFARDGGLLSYAVDIGDLFRRAAPYVDHILRGTKPAELPVQLPIKFEMVVNLKTAKVLGLTVPQKLIYTADEVIE
jgi:putative tryptophan/tyrosine transport system substrate-binding protein